MPSLGDLKSGEYLGEDPRCLGGDTWSLRGDLERSTTLLEEKWGLGDLLRAPALSVLLTLKETSCFLTGDLDCFLTVLEEEGPPGNLLEPDEASLEAEGS